MERKELLTSLLSAVSSRTGGDERDNPYERGTSPITDALEILSEPFRPSGHPGFDRAMAALGPIWRYGRFDPGFTQGSGELADVEFIAMPFPENFATPADYRLTAAHELTHWTRHRTRLNRGGTGASELDRLFGRVPKGYPEEEAVAELGGAMLADALGVPPDIEGSAAYIAGWLNDIADPAARDRKLHEAAERATTAVDYLLARMAPSS